MLETDVGASFLVYHLFMLSDLNLLNRLIKHWLNLLKLLSGKLLLIHEGCKVFLRWVSVGKEDILRELDIVGVRPIIIFGWISIVDGVQCCNYYLLSFNQLIIFSILSFNSGRAFRVTLVESRCFLMGNWLRCLRHFIFVKTRLYMQILHVNREGFFLLLFYDLLFTFIFLLLRAIGLALIFWVEGVMFFFRFWRVNLINFLRKA